MPTYTYACSNCGEFERQQSMADLALDRCPECGGPVQRLITGGSGFIIKGGGASPNRCSRDTPCCGREVRCDKPPCES